MTLPNLDKTVTKDPVPPATDTVLTPIFQPSDGTVALTTLVMNKEIDNINEIIDYISGENGAGTIPISAITGTMAQFDTALTDGDFIFVGDAPTAHTHVKADITDTPWVFSEIQNITTARILGRVTAATGVIEELTGTQATTLLDVFTSALQGLAPLSGGGTTNFLRADGTWADPAAGGGEVFTWTANHDAAGFDLDNVGGVISNATNPASNTNVFRMGNLERLAWRNIANTNDAYITLNGSDDFEFRIDGGAVLTISPTQFNTQGGNVLVGAGLIQFETANITINGVSGDLEYDVATGDMHEMRIDNTDEFVVTATSIDIDAKYIELESIASPGTTGFATTGRIFMDTANSDHLSTIRNGSIIDLEGAGGGEVFTWTADHSAAGFDLNNLSLLVFQSSTDVAPAGTVRTIYYDDIQGMMFNALAGDFFQWEIGAAARMRLDDTQLQLSSGQNLTLNDNADIQWGGSVDRKIKNTTGGFEFEVETSDTFLFTVQDGEEMELDASQLDLKGNTLTNLLDITSITSLNGVGIGSYVIGTDNISAISASTTAQYNTSLTGTTFVFGSDNISALSASTVAQYNTSLTGDTFFYISDNISAMATSTSAQFNTANSDDTFFFISDNISNMGTSTSAQFDTANSDGTFMFDNATNVVTGAIQITAGTMRIPLSATPTMAVDGDFAIDTDLGANWSMGLPKYFDGEEMVVVALPVADTTSPTGGHVVTYNATDNEFELVAGGGGASVIGSQQFSVAAGSLYPGITTGSGAIAQREIGANNQQIKYIPFGGNPSGDTIAYFDWFVPENIDIDNEIRIKLFWTTEDPAVSGDDFEIEITGVALENDDAIGGTAFGTAVAITDTWLANDDVHITAQSGDLNPVSTPAIAGTIAKNSWIQFKFLRDVSFVTVNDAPLQLIGGVVEYNIDAETSGG